jgi:hypothetical protein
MLQKFKGKLFLRADLRRGVSLEIEENIQVMVRRVRRRTQLLDGLKETRGYWILTEEALDHSLWRTWFGRVYGPVARLEWKMQLAGRDHFGILVVCRHKHVCILRSELNCLTCGPVVRACDKLMIIDLLVQENTDNLNIFVWISVSVTVTLCCRDKWVPVTTAWRVLRLRMEERPADMEVSCKYTEKAVADSRQGVVLQLGGWERC